MFVVRPNVALYFFVEVLCCARLENENTDPINKSNQQRYSKLVKTVRPILQFHLEPLTSL